MQDYQSSVLSSVFLEEKDVILGSVYLLNVVFPDNFLLTFNFVKVIH